MIFCFSCSFYLLCVSVRRFCVAPSLPLHSSITNDDSPWHFLHELISTKFGCKSDHLLSLFYPYVSKSEVISYKTYEFVSPIVKYNLSVVAYIHVLSTLLSICWERNCNLYIVIFRLINFVTCVKCANDIELHMWGLWPENYFDTVDIHITENFQSVQ